MENILIVYSTCDGQTRKICQKIKWVTEEMGHDVKMVSIDDWFREDLGEFDKIVVGASIRYGKHNKKVIDFVVQNKKLLEDKFSAFFSVNVVARKASKNAPENNPYLKRFLSQVSWRPDQVAVFAGKIDYQKYGLLDRMIILLIMYLTKGPTNQNAVVDYTNWEQVENFGRVIGEKAKRK